MSSRYSENVGAGATTTSPASSATASVAWISSLEPLPDQHAVRRSSRSAAASAASSAGGANSG